MIKINLASLKQSVLAAAGKESSPADGSTLADLGFGSTIRKPTASDLKKLPIRPILIGVVVYLGGSELISMTKTEQLDKVQAQITKAEADNKTLKTKIEKGKQLQDLKLALEADEKVIRTKLDLIKKLMGDRKTALELIVQISKSMPSEVWMTDINVKSTEKDLEIGLKGSSLGFSQISDFMKNLSESVLFKDVQLGGTQQQKDEKGYDVYQFDLSLKKK